MIMAAAADGAHHVASTLPFKIALIGVLGIGAQWLAWKLQRPAIVLMAIAGLVFGPLIGWALGFNLPSFVTGTLELFRLDPINDFGDLYRPMIGLAVAIILFEGGMTLRFKDLGDARQAVIRMVIIAGPIAWGLGTCAAHFIVGLPWDALLLESCLAMASLGPSVVVTFLNISKRPSCSLGSSPFTFWLITSPMKLACSP